MASSPAAFSPYEPRTITFAGLHRTGGTTLKVYGISRTAEPVPAPMFAAAQCIAGEYVAAPRAECHAGGVDWAACEEHGLGSLIVHPGREALYVLVDLWVGENMLRHRVWAAPFGDDLRFEPLAPSDVAICVWELAVVQHERAAWLRHMLTPSGRTDADAYLADVLNATV